jgi:hypothetical protein
MRWKWVALAGALGPAAVGCNLYRNAARNLVNEPLTVCTQRGILHRLHKEANAAWRQVRADYPRRAFTAEFRDGFVDGYVDYLDRGGNGSVPAVPPTKYARHLKYYSEEGQCLLKDYFLGFRYGQEIAIATGKRQFLTVPVLLPVQPEGPPAFTIVPPGPPVPPELVPVPVPPVLPQPNSVGAGGAPPSKFVAPSIGSPPPGAAPPSPPAPPVAAAGVAAPAEAPPAEKLPAPPPEVPELPAHVPTPSVLDDLPVVPPIHAEPPAVAPTHAEPPAVPPTHPEAVGK